MHRRCSTLSARSMDRSEHAMQSLARPPPRPQNSPQQHNEEEGGHNEEEGGGESWRTERFFWRGTKNRLRLHSQES